MQCYLAFFLKATGVKWKGVYVNLSWILLSRLLNQPSFPPKGEFQFRGFFNIGGSGICKDCLCVGVGPQMNKIWTDREDQLQTLTLRLHVPESLTRQELSQGPSSHRRHVYGEAHGMSPRSCPCSPEDSTCARKDVACTCRVSQWPCRNKEMHHHCLKCLGMGERWWAFLLQLPTLDAITSITRRLLHSQAAIPASTQVSPPTVLTKAPPGATCQPWLWGTREAAPCTGCFLAVLN